MNLKHRTRLLLPVAAAVMVLAFLSWFRGWGANSDGEVVPYCYRVVQEYPHDCGAFTQGLVYEAGSLYEGTGLRGRSSLRKTDLATGRVERIRKLADPYFGEGITVFDGKIIQLTWRSRVGFVYDQQTFELQGTFAYPTEGWGLTHDDRRLIMSDGSDLLYFLDPGTYQRLGRVRVRDGREPVGRLNELEFINGNVYANVWQTDRIAVIDPGSGRVRAWVDLNGLLKPADRRVPVDVLNGIAFDPGTERLWVTGKLWPKLFEIELTACP